MNGIFSPDSRFMQILNVVSDFVILNVIYLLCCLPVFTIGAAQAGFYTAMRTITDPEDDSSCLKAFFRGFAGGFGRVTLVWSALAVLMGVLVWSLLLVGYYGGGQAAVWMSVAGVCVCALFQSVITPFHARFQCTALQLLRNAFFLILGNPLRCIGVTVLTWGPVILGLLSVNRFLQGTIVVLTIYYSLAFLFNTTLLRKPFQRLTENFYKAQGLAQDPG